MKAGRGSLVSTNRPIVLVLVLVLVIAPYDTAEEKHRTEVTEATEGGLLPLILAKWHDTRCRMAKTIEFKEEEMRDHVKMAAVVRHGLPVQAALNLADRLQISQDRLSELASIPKRTLHRRAQQGF